MSLSPVPLKTRRVGQRCTLNLSRSQTSSRWCGVVLRRTRLPAQEIRHHTRYGGYDSQLVIEWARVRIPNKVLQEKKLDFRLKWIPVSNGKQRTLSVVCWDPHL
ncbi:hypothetical protein TNCV_4854581 [Trichonephila clavipes]|nr:hypothetical protein TNCV_4854581 [Trichonephila clavipes]